MFRQVLPKKTSVQSNVKYTESEQALLDTSVKNQIAEVKTVLSNLHNEFSYDVIIKASTLATDKNLISVLQNEAIKIALFNAATKNDLTSFRDILENNTIDENVIFRAARLATHMSISSFVAEFLNARHYAVNGVKTQQIVNANNPNSSTPTKPASPDTETITAPQNYSQTDVITPDTPKNGMVAADTVTPPTPPTPLSQMQKNFIFGGVKLPGAQVEGCDPTNSSSDKTTNSHSVSRALNFSHYSKST